MTYNSLYRIRTAGVVLVFAAMIAGGCNTTDHQSAFLSDAMMPPSGITRTNLDGEVLSEDPDDWRISPVHVGLIIVEPAYPNPTTGSLVFVPVNIRQFNAVPAPVTLRALDVTNRFTVLDRIHDTASPGVRVMQFQPGLLGSAGLHRLFIFDGRGEVISYGDLCVSPCP
jgi:hypothetical protein